jgi:hypothetical protein
MEEMIFRDESLRESMTRSQLLKEKYATMRMDRLNPLMKYFAVHGKCRYDNLVICMGNIAELSKRICFGLGVGPEFEHPEKCLIIHWQALVLQYFLSECDPMSDVGFRVGKLDDSVLKRYIDGVPIKFTDKRMKRLATNRQGQISPRWVKRNLMHFFEDDGKSACRAVRKVLIALFRLALTYACMASARLNAGLWTLGGVKYNRSKRNDSILADETNMDIANMPPVQVGILNKTLDDCVTDPIASLPWSKCRPIPAYLLSIILVLARRFGYTKQARASRDQWLSEKVDHVRRGNRISVSGDLSDLFSNDVLMESVLCYVEYFPICRVKYQFLYPGTEKLGKTFEMFTTLLNHES